VSIIVINVNVHEYVLIPACVYMRACVHVCVCVCVCVCVKLGVYELMREKSVSVCSCERYC